MPDKTTDEAEISIQVLNIVTYFQDHPLKKHKLLSKYSDYARSINETYQDLLNLRDLDESYVKSLYFSVYQSKEIDFEAVYRTLQVIDYGIIYSGCNKKDLLYNINTGFLPFAYAIKQYYRQETGNE